MQRGSFFRKAKQLNIQLTPHDRINGLLGHTFRSTDNNNWLHHLKDTETNFLLIGNDVGRLYHGLSQGLGDHLILLVTNKPNSDPGWFEEDFFKSLQPHTRIYETNEVVFESGLTLDVRDILEKPENSSIRVARLSKRGLFGRLQTWYYSRSQSICKRSTMEVLNGCVIVNIERY